MNRAQAAAIATAKGEELLRRSFEEWLLLVDRNEECSVVSDDGVVYTVSAEAWQESREPRKIELVVAVTDGSLRSGFAPVVWRQEVNGVRGS